METQKGKIEWPQEAIMELIKIWETNECLYNPKHRYYHNKHARQDALSEIAEELKAFNPAIGPNEVKNKLQYLRAQYTRDLAKSKERKSGAGAEEEYVSCSNWLYKLAFLHDYVQVRKGGCNLYERISGVSDDSLDCSSLDCETFPAQPRKKARVSSDAPRTSSTSSGMTLGETVLTAASTLLENMSPNIPTPSVPEEKIRNLCNYLQSELADITDLDERDEVMDELTEVIREAKKRRRMAKKFS